MRKYECRLRHAEYADGSILRRKKSHGNHGNHGNVFLNTNCRYDDTQSTQINIDCAEKWEHKLHESYESY